MTLSPEQVLEFALRSPPISIPDQIQVRTGETIVDVPLYISTNICRMYCGVPILEAQAKSRMIKLSITLNMNYLDYVTILNPPYNGTQV